MYGTISERLGWLDLNLGIWEVESCNLMEEGLDGVLGLVYFKGA